MSRRENEKKRALDALSKIAYASSQPTAPAPPPPPPRPSAPPPDRAAPPAPRPPPAATTEADRLRAKQLEERREKLAEERALRERRERELARGSRLEWRGGGFTDIPASIRRTGFDREEPSVSQKIHDILGDAREKEGRAKSRDKGRRQGGRG